ncbi:RagB/SusD family nutrient uptake outer membrane protein [Parapedobacter soli]|uniref:RagB/SusD family nutrient uptake outer membrane protein n=1 Tax=Parapedobacter soli TaxID=416955 RepID=UPI0021C8C060|nr:RagB/SusD family nutrient uptake outer membrane protein [Parapedobacter soli]
MKYLLASILIILSIVSCNDALLVDPSDQYSANTFWTEPEHFEAGLAGVYNSLYGMYNLFNGETDMITPNAKAYNEANGTDAIANGSALATTGLFSSLWNNAYQGIGRCNTLLDRLENSPMQLEESQLIAGQALFIRSLLYHYLVDHFGGVPLILETPDPELHGRLPRTEKNIIIDRIISDLDRAATVLPIRYDQAGLGKATKGAALALKSRVLLFEERWSEAAQAAKAVIDLNRYELFGDYRGIWYLENENNVEVIFDIQYQVPFFTHGFDHVSKLLNRPAPLKDLVDAYLMIDGTSIDESELYNSEKPYENRDPRLHQSIVVAGYPYNGQIATSQDVVTTGFGNKKHTVYKDDVAIANVVANNSELNIIIMRYAEVLLNYAEALNESTGPTDNVYWALNEIRKRPSVGMPLVKQGLTKDEMREVIRLERRVELALEGRYYSDIRRWKIAEQTNNSPIYNAAGGVIERRTFNSQRDYLWAIPPSQIDLNPELEQNPNW